MHLTVRHATAYAYDPPAERCALRLRLYPPSFDSQRVTSWKVSVNGAAIPPLLTTPTGDRESIWTCSVPAAQIEIVAEGKIDTADATGVVRGLKETARPAVFLRSTPLTGPDARIEALARGVSGRTKLDLMHALLNGVRDAVDYIPAATTAQTTAAQALKLGKGVCQDHAHVFIAAARARAIPARYVVGYLLALDTKLTETHAWAEAFLPEIGWVGFDPANRLCPTDRYVRLACGLDSADAAPIRGGVSGTPEERLSASVDISQTQGQNSQGQNQTQQ